MKIFRNLTIATLVAAAACGGGGASNSVTNPTGGNPTGGNPTGGNDTPTATNAVGVADNNFTPGEHCRERRDNGDVDVESQRVDA